MFDGEAFGAQMVEIVRGYVAAEIEPLVAANQALSERIAELEARQPLQGEKGEPGEAGRDGVDGKDTDPSAVALALVGERGPELVQFLKGEIVVPAELIADEVAKAVAELPPAEKGDPGADADMEAIEALIGAKVADAVAAIPPARDGQDVEVEVTQDGAVVEFAFIVGEARSTFEVELPRGPEGPAGNDGPVGKLEQAKAWTDEVHYSGAVRTHQGGTWQAQKDTAKEPPHDDWICIAAPGINGQDGRSLNPRRLWVAEEEYKSLDVVALNGSSFVAVRDDPGACPGDGWMLMTAPGKRGERGEKGERGERGERGLPGAAVIAASINDQGLQTLINGDGTTVQCDLYPLISEARN